MDLDLAAKVLPAPIVVVLIVLGLLLKSLGWLNRQEANAEWVKFWQWRDRAVRAGDIIAEMEQNYFTYY